VKGEVTRAVKRDALSRWRKIRRYVNRNEEIYLQIKVNGRHVRTYSVRAHRITSFGPWLTDHVYAEGRHSTFTIDIPVEVSTKGIHVR
jgi:hypothetical protein